MENKYYSLPEAIKMIPLVLSYGKSIRVGLEQEKHRVQTKKLLQFLLTLDTVRKDKINRILSKIETRDELILIAAKRWRQELDDFNLVLCSMTQGIVDIPVWDDVTGQVMHLCVQAGINKKNIFWHLPAENYLHRRPCWAEMGKNK